MTKPKINRIWATCITIAAIPLVPFFFSLATSDSLNVIFENNIIEPIFTIYLVVGIIPMAAFWGLVARITGLDDRIALTLVMILAGLIATFFWGTILYWIYNMLQKRKK